MSARSVSRKSCDRFEEERALLKAGFSSLAGVDEAGRGPLAGPVVAAAVILPSTWIEQGIPPDLKGLNDSKQLSTDQREAFFEIITNKPSVRSGVAIIDAAIIDQINILRATHKAMADALGQLTPPPAHILVDGNHVKSLTLPQTALVKGDSRSYSIAAASILAKVTRDRLMLEYDLAWPEYGFAEHKGYGTPQHLEAIARLGPCPIHRRTFAPLKPKQPELF